MKSMVQNVEDKCRTNTFAESTADVAKYRLQLQSWPSEIIQARISFDAVQIGALRAHTTAATTCINIEKGTHSHITRTE